MRAGRAATPLAVIALITLALASGCASIPEIKVPDTVQVPVPVPCVAPAGRPQRPATRTEDDLMAMDTYRRTLAAWADLTRLRAYAGELEAVVEGCARIPTTTGGPPMQ